MLAERRSGWRVAEILWSDSGAPQDFGGMTKSWPAPALPGAGALRLPAGRARQDLRPSVWRRALRPAAFAFGRRPARGAPCTPLGEGRGAEWRGCDWGGAWVSPTLRRAGALRSPARAGAAGFGAVRQVESRIACVLRLRRSAHRAGRCVFLFRSLWQRPCPGMGCLCGVGGVRAARSAAAGGRGVSRGRGGRGSWRGSSPILPHRESR